MHVAIAGAHGQVARLLARQLTTRGDEVRGLIRKPEQADDLRADGQEPVVLDLEASDVDEVAAAIAGVDAVVFAAGAGPGSGPERKWTVDHGAAVKLREACEAAGVERYVMVSAMGTDDPPPAPDDPEEQVFDVYLRAKAAADEDLMASDLGWTIVRPGRLTDEPGTATVTLARHVERGEVPREDVATVLRACLDDERTAGHVFEVVGGDLPVIDAVAALARD